MLGTERLLPDGERALIERLGLRVLALGMVEQRQVVEARGHIGMLGAEGLLPDGERALIERLGLRVLALGMVERRQVVEARGHIGDVRGRGSSPRWRARLLGSAVARRIVRPQGQAYPPY